MVNLQPGTILLKPAQKRRILNHLRRCDRVAGRGNEAMLTVTLKPVGRFVEARARVHDHADYYTCTSRQKTWQEAIAGLIKELHGTLHGRKLAVAA